MDKKDEEELREWKEKNLNYVETYGVDIYDENKKGKETTKKIEIANKIIKIILIIFAVLIIVGIAVLLVYRWKIVHDIVNGDIADPLTNVYNMDI